MGEILIFVVVVLFGVAGEYVIEAVGDVFGQSFVKIAEPRQSHGEILDFVIYGATGVIFGVLSVWLLPDNFIKESQLKIVGLIINPIIAGLALCWLKRETDSWFRLSAFLNGWICVFLIALTRFVFTN